MQWLVASDQWQVKRIIDSTRHKTLVALLLPPCPHLLNLPENYFVCDQAHALIKG